MFSVALASFAEQRGLRERAVSLESRDWRWQPGREATALRCAVLYTACCCCWCTGGRRLRPRAHPPAQLPNLCGRLHVHHTGLALRHDRYPAPAGHLYLQRAPILVSPADPLTSRSILSSPFLRQPLRSLRRYPITCSTHQPYLFSSRFSIGFCCTTVATDWTSSHLTIDALVLIDAPG